MRLNVIQIRSSSGYRSFEVRHLDIADLPEPVDVLVVSAFTRDYTPTRTSLVGALHARGIFLATLAGSPDLDLRPRIGAWLSREGVSHDVRRILCVEAAYDLDPEARLSCLLDALRDGLAIAAARGVPVARTLVPLLGTGDQGLTPERVAEALVSRLRELADGIPALRTVQFFSHREDRARSLSDALDRQLGREDVRLRANDLDDAVRDDVRASLERVGHRLPRLLVDEIHDVLDPERPSTAVQVAVTCRNVCEGVVADLIDAPKRAGSLYEQIEALAQQGTATWIRQYLHTLRALGNAAAHVARDEPRRSPAHLERRDLVVGLFCMQRVLAYWASIRT